jgi:hypothetical protein
VTAPDPQLEAVARVIADVQREHREWDRASRLERHLAAQILAALAPVPRVHPRAAARSLDAMLIAARLAAPQPRADARR